MGHHHHHHGHCHGHDSTENIRTAFFLNLAFTIIEIIGGLYTNSLAILSDALHDLGDSFSLGLSWYFQKLSDKGSNEKYTFGYKRFSLLGAVINSVVLLTGSIIMLSEAIPGLFNPVQPDSQGMMLLAVLGVVVNGAAVLKLKKGSSLNEKAVATHLLEDVLGWIAVLIGSIIMHFWDIPIIDPILSIGISCFILYNVFGSVKEAIQIILQQVPTSVDVEELNKKIKEVQGIHDIHDLHVWSMDGEYNVLTVHIVLRQEHSIGEMKAIKQRVLLVLKTEKIKHVTMEFDLLGDTCRELGNEHL